MTAPTATLLVSCPDQRGLVAKIAHFVYSHNGNIIHADHHTDFAHNTFLSRIEWSLEGFQLPRDEIGPQFGELARTLDRADSAQVNWELHFSDEVPRLSIWVSKQDHCLLDLLWRRQARELAVEIPLIIGNHTTLEPLARQFNIEFLHLPITPETKAAQEAKQYDALQRHRVDLVVLAKYMQILSPAFLERLSSATPSPRIINIHHSFLPAFPGAKPYQRAHDRGVKIIGATAHYVTPELDEGPIIEQEVVRVSHRDTVEDMVRKGKDLERLVLSRATRLHLQHRVLVYGNRTVVFD